MDKVYLSPIFSCLIMEIGETVKRIRVEMENDWGILPSFLGYVHSESGLDVPSLEVDEKGKFLPGYSEDKELEPGGYIILNPMNVNGENKFIRKLVNIDGTYMCGAYLFSTGMDRQRLEEVVGDNDGELSENIDYEVGKSYDGVFPILFSGPFDIYGLDN